MSGGDLAWWARGVLAVPTRGDGVLPGSEPFPLCF